MQGAQGAMRRHPTGTTAPSAASRVGCRRAYLSTPVAHRRAARAQVETSRHSRQLMVIASAQAAPSEGAVADQAADHDAPSAAFSWKAHWFPVVYARDVGPKDLYPFTLLEEPIVVWRDAAGKARAFADRCPHRLVPLSTGRIAASGELECPYHGWQFSGDGACTLIPQGGETANPRTCATAYQCEERQGVIWVKLQPAGAAAATDDIPTLPELDSDDWFELAPMWRDLPMDYSTLIENVVDAAHVPFTHHASVSKRQSSGSYADMKVTEKGPWGFRGVWETGPRRGALGAQHTLFQGPNLMRHTIDAFSTRGFANITAVYGAPISPGRCRLFVRQPFRFKNRAARLLFGLMPEFMSHLGNLSVLDDDNKFLHHQERTAAKLGLAEQPVGKVFHMPGPSDAYIIAFRAWLDRVAGGGPFGRQNASWLAAAGPVLPDTALLDHFHSHTEHCSVCKSALRRVTALRAVSSAAAVLGAVVAVAAATVQFAVSRLPEATAAAVPLPGSGLLPLVLGGAAVAAVAGAVWAWCSKTLPRFFTGVLPPPRNTVAGEWTAL